MRPVACLNRSDRQEWTQCPGGRRRAGREPRLGTIVRLAGALGVTPGALCVGMTWNEDGRRFEFPPD